jgi:hypothetical protein
MSATIIQFKPKPTDDDGPPSQWAIDRELWDTLLGMTSRQSEMAFKLCFRNRDRSRATRAALSRYIEAMRVFEPALDAYREELRKNMDMFCPRAAKRIREGKPPRRTRKRLGPVRPAVDEAGSPR